MTLTLPVRQPYNFDWVFDYLSTRAMEGIEAVQGIVMCDSCLISRALWWWCGRVSVRVQLPSSVESIYTLLRRVARMFDLNADSATIDAHLRRDGQLAPWVKKAGGLRVQGHGMGLKPR